jgi:hypothetical protein
MSKSFEKALKRAYGDAIPGSVARWNRQQAERDWYAQGERKRQAQALPERVDGPGRHRMCSRCGQRCTGRRFCWPCYVQHLRDRAKPLPVASADVLAEMREAYAKALEVTSR